MIKFEEHEGLIFKMLDKPEPLTVDAEMPCLVRLIQDDSPMGLCNRWKYSEKQDFLKKDWTISLLENNLNKVKDIHYSQFEIIGYPVEEGSRWWALYSAMNGKSFVHKDAKQCRIFTMFSERELRMSDGEGETVEYVEIDEFLNDAAKDGWQIYKEPKPEPLLADAKVGDLCKRMDGKWVQVDSYSNDRPCPIMCKSDIGGQDCFTLDGRNHNAVNDSKDIIHTEPLAPEGSAEWALQMWKLGNDIRNETGVVLMADYESEEIRVKHLVDVFTSGWQLYEPEPEPAKEKFKVGDESLEKEIKWLKNELYRLINERNALVKINQQLQDNLEALRNENLQLIEQIGGGE